MLVYYHFILGVSHDGEIWQSNGMVPILCCLRTFCSILLRPPDRQRKNTHFPWKKTPAWSLSVFSFILFLKTPAAVIRPVLPVNVPVLVQPCQSFHIKIISPDITFIHPVMIAGIVLWEQFVSSTASTHGTDVPTSVFRYVVEGAEKCPRLRNITH